MSNSTISNIIYTTLNLLSGVIDIFALMICFIFLSLISYRLIRIKYQQRRVSIDLSSILCINTLCTIIIKSLMQMISITLPTLKKDFNLITEFNDTFTCHLTAYLLWSMIGSLYWSYALLTFFRFSRVIYSRSIWLQRSTLYLYILIPAQYILVCISLLPLLLIFHSMQVVAQEAYCSVLTDPMYHIIYTSVIIFFMPLTAIVIFYIFIVRKMRQTAPVIRLYTQRNKRDFVVIRRVLLNMIVLSIVSLPYTIVYIISKIRAQSIILTYRIQWTSSSFASILFSIILPFITTQLRDLLKSNKITVMNAPK